MSCWIWFTTCTEWCTDPSNRGHHPIEYSGMFSQLCLLNVPFIVVSQCSLVAWMLEQSPFPPYLTRDMLTRVCDVKIMFTSTFPFFLPPSLLPSPSHLFPSLSLATSQWRAHTWYTRARRCWSESSVGGGNSTYISTPVSGRSPLQ